MTAIDGPPEPALSAKDPQKRLDEQKAAREKSCQGKEDTRN